VSGTERRLTVAGTEIEPPAVAVLSTQASRSCRSGGLLAKRRCRGPQGVGAPAARISRDRRRVVWPPAGVETVSELWVEKPVPP